MIPMIGLLIWAYGVARMIEIMYREGDRAPSGGVFVTMLIMLVVMTFACVMLFMGGFKE